MDIRKGLLRVVSTTLCGLIQSGNLPPWKPQIWIKQTFKSYESALHLWSCLMLHLSLTPSLPWVYVYTSINRSSTSLSSCLFVLEPMPLKIQTLASYPSYSWGLPIPKPKTLFSFLLYSGSYIIEKTLSTQWGMPPSRQGTIWVHMFCFLAVQISGFWLKNSKQMEHSSVYGYNDLLTQ